MNGNTRIAAPLGLLLLALAPFAQAQQEGNASAATCLSRNQVTAGTSPAALMNALPRCVQDGRMQDAIDLYNIAGVFAHFDRQRVADETGHSAYNALKAMAGSAMGEENLGRFDSALKAQLSPDKAPAYVAGICSFSKRVGPPSYAPTYMLAHGMSNFTGTGGGLVPGFEPASAWQATLSQYLKCPG